MLHTQVGAERKVVRVDPVISPEWAELVSSLPSTLFHSPAWMTVLQQTYGLPLSAYVLTQEGRPTGGVAWCEMNDFLGARRVTLAFSDLCDPLASTPEDLEALASSVVADGLPWNLRARARAMPHLNVQVRQSTHYKWQGIGLTTDTESLWNRLSSMAQRGVRKAQRDGVVVREAAGKAELREWFMQHLRLRKSKHGLLAQPYAFFENIWDGFIEKGQGFLLVAEHGGKMIGGTVYLLSGDTCFYKFNASDPEALSVRPNNLLMWEGMLRAKERGCRLLDLGRSNAHQEGLIAFKRGFGAVEEDLFSVTYGSPEDETQGEKEARRLLGQLTRLFAQGTVPEDVTEEAGALLYRYFV